MHIRYPQVMRYILAALPIVTALTAMPQTVFAETLQNWRVDNQQNRLEFTTDEPVQPEVQFVPNPSRLVVTLPGIRWAQPKINQPYNGLVRSLRIARFEPTTTRMVVDLAPDTTIDPTKVVVRPSANRSSWTIQLPPGTSTNGQPTPTGDVAIAVPPMPAPQLSTRIPNGRSLTWLQQRLAELQPTKYKNLDPGTFILDLDTGDFASVNGSKVFPTASIIKLPILIAFLQDVEAGKIRLSETLTMTDDVIVGGSGFMQDAPVGSKYSATEVINNMITASDNTATNMVIKRIGGIDLLNRRFQSWGLNKTRIRNWLPDLSGTNTTTPQELIKVMGMLEQGELLSTQKANAINIMQHVKNQKLLPQGLGTGARIAHKTGDIGFLLGDSGIVYMPNGKRYLIAVLVTSSVYDDYDAVYYIRETSRIVYNYLNNGSNSNVGALPNTLPTTLPTPRPIVNLPKARPLPAPAIFRPGTR
jgi:beta-lactamase class A